MQLTTFDNDTYIYIKEYQNLDYSIKYIIKNDYSDNFITRVEANTKIEETANNIELNVNQKLGNYSTVEETNASINMKADEINQTVSKKVGNDEIISKINQSSEAVGIDAKKIELSAKDILNLLAGNTINLKSKNILISSDCFNVTNEGKVVIKGNKDNNDLLKVEMNGNSSVRSYIQPIGAGFVNGSSDKAIYIMASDDISIIELNGLNGYTEVTNTGIRTPILTQTSLEESKKNFEKLENGLDIVKNTEIYKYNLKSQNDDDKKHIGFVIGKDYKYSDKITAVDDDGKEVGVDTYSMISVAYKAIQEQQEQIQELQEKLEKLEGGRNEKDNI